MKRFFLVLLVLLAGIAVLSAGPPQPGGASDALQMIMPPADSAASIEAPGMPEPMLPGGGVVAQDNDAAVTEAIERICLWAYQYLAGLLTEDEFKTLAAGRITVLYLRELKMGIRKTASLAPDEFPLLR